MVLGNGRSASLDRQRPPERMASTPERRVITRSPHNTVAKIKTPMMLSVILIQGNVHPIVVLAGLVLIFVAGAHFCCGGATACDILCSSQAVRAVATRSVQWPRGPCSVFDFGPVWSLITSA